MNNLHTSYASIVIVMLCVGIACMRLSQWVQIKCRATLQGLRCVLLTGIQSVDVARHIEAVAILSCADLWTGMIVGESPSASCRMRWQAWACLLRQQWLGGWWT